MGLKSFILLVDCPGCVFINGYKCYDLKICLYNDSITQNLCRSNWKYEYFKLNETSCPLGNTLPDILSKFS